MKNLNLSHLKANVIANYFGKIWSISSVYIFVPLYIYFLGIEAYGVVAFSSVLLSIAFIADAGFSSSISREAAQAKCGEQLIVTLVTLERIMLVVLTFAGFLIILFGNWLATNWFKDRQNLDFQVLVDSLRLIPFAILPQILMSLYFGAMMGLEKQISANAYMIVFSMIRSGLVILPIAFIPDVRVFLLWQSFAVILFAMLMRFQTIRAIRLKFEISNQFQATFSFVALKNIYKFALGMMTISLISAVNTQADKLVVSKILDLATFAQYNLMSTISLAPYIVTLPITLAFLPRFTAVVSRGESKQAGRLYEDFTFATAVIGSVVGTALIFFGREIVHLWLPDTVIRDSSILSLQILSMGTIFLSFQLMPYQMGLAYGHTRTSMVSGLSMILILIPLQIHLTLRHGVVGAAIPWLLLNFMGYLILGIRLNSMFCHITAQRYLVTYTGFVLCLSAVGMGLAKMLAKSFGSGSLASICIAALMASILLAIAFIMHWWRNQHLAESNSL